jgi:hypothetical protein
MTKMTKHPILKAVDTQESTNYEVHRKFGISIIRYPGEKFTVDLHLQVGRRESWQQAPRSYRMQSRLE